MQPIYIEVGDEITTVIERIREAPGASVALIIPKGAILLQSIVNLKLARKAAQESGTQVTLVTTDKTGRNLATQVGFAVRSKIDGPDEAAAVAEGEMAPGVRVHRYYDETAEEADSPRPAAVMPIIPRTIVKPEAPAVPVIPLTPAPPVDPEPAIPESPITTRTLDIAIPPARNALPVIEIIRPSAKIPAVAPVALPLSPAAPEQPPAASLPTPREASDMPASPLKAKTAKPKPLRRVPRPLLFAIYLLILAALVTTGIAAFYWPKTVVTAHLHPETKTQDLSVTAGQGSATDAKNLTVPLETLSATASDTATFQATGSKEIGEVAKGSVQLRNFTDSDPQTLPAGAQLTAGGRTFITSAAATVPGFRRSNGQDVPGTASVAVQADGPGEGGNVTADTVAIISPSTHLNALTLATTGGTSKQVKVVTQNDINTAKTALLAKLKDAASATLAKQAGDQAVLADSQSDKTTTDKMTPSVLPDTQADSGQINGQITVKRLGVASAHLDELAKARMAQTVDPQHTLAEASAKVVKASCTADACTVQITATATLVANVDLQPLAKKLAGTVTRNGLDLLKGAAPDADFTVERHPAWWPNRNFPPSAKYISIVVKHD